MHVLTVLLFWLAHVPVALGQDVDDGDHYGAWMERDPSEWPEISMINQIEYADADHPVAGCGFLVDTGDEVLAATAKHVLIFFKSEAMTSVSFSGMLMSWKMFPKNNPDDLVVIDRLINEDTEEPLDDVPADRDWLLFTVKERSPNIQPLRLRTDPVRPGEAVFIVGWRYSDTDCPQVIYEGSFVRDEEGSFLITTRELADNKMPGLSGAPVIDSRGYLIGLMSQKAGKMERPSSLEYPASIIDERTSRRESAPQPAPR